MHVSIFTDWETRLALLIYADSFPVEHMLLAKHFHYLWEEIQRPCFLVYFIWNATLSRFLGNSRQSAVSCVHFRPSHLFLHGQNLLSPLSLMATLAIIIHSRALITSESRSNPACVCRDTQNCHHAVLLREESVSLRCIVMTASFITHGM